LKLTVDGKMYELDWKEAAVLLVLRLVDWHALTLSDVELVAGNYNRAVQLVERLVKMGFLKEFKVRKLRIYALTELGERAADEVKRKAEEAGLWKAGLLP